MFSGYDLFSVNGSLGHCGLESGLNELKIWVNSTTYYCTSLSPSTIAIRIVCWARSSRGTCCCSYGRSKNDQQEKRDYQLSSQHVLLLLCRQARSNLCDKGAHLFLYVICVTKEERPRSESTIKWTVWNIIFGASHGLFISVSNDGIHAVITVHVILVSVRWAEKSGHDAAEYLLIHFNNLFSQQ